MKLLTSILAVAILSMPLLQAKDLKVFELRTYTANGDKLDALHDRFRGHTLALFEKHGMTNLIYWVPEDNEANQLVYLLGYPNREARDKSWKDFRNDADWKAAYNASIADGKLVAKVDSLFLELTDYSPSLETLKTDPSRLYEMRHYTTNSGKLPKLDARFRDHTVELFEKHGMNNLPYFHLSEGQDGSGTTLLYFLSFKDVASRDASFKAFSQDPDWIKARDKSQADGEKILIKKGVASIYLKTTDYSPEKGLAAK